MFVLFLRDRNRHEFTSSSGVLLPLSFVLPLSVSGTRVSWDVKGLRRDPKQVHLIPFLSLG